MEDCSCHEHSCLGPEMQKLRMNKIYTLLAIGELQETIESDKLTSHQYEVAVNKIKLLEKRIAGYEYEISK